MLTSPCFDAASKHFSVHNSISRNILLYCSGRSLRLSPGARSTNDEGRMVSSQSNIIILLPSAAFDEVGGDMISSRDGDGVCRFCNAADKYYELLQ